MPHQTTDEFMRALNRLIARRGWLETIYSDKEVRGGFQIDQEDQQIRNYSSPS